MTKNLKAIQILWIGIMLTSACRDVGKYPYAIRDFKKGYQPYLTEAVSSNLVGYDSSAIFIKERLLDEELKKLSISEHPLLRALALEELTSRPSVNQYELIRHHLDDTAIIYKDIGEFGVAYTTVSDNMIKQTRWRDSAERLKIIDAVMMEHAYLGSAYAILDKLGQVEKYYPVIKQMTQKRRNDEELSEALLALASYKKKSDVEFIRQTLFQKRGLIKESFYLMHAYPDTSYMSFLDTYAKRLYGAIYAEPLRNMIRNQEDAIFFFSTVAGYRNKKSAEILANLLHRTVVPNLLDTVTFRNGLNDAIIANSCSEYSTLIKELSGYIIKKAIRQRKDSIENLKYPMDFVYNTDTSTQKPIIQW